MTSQGSIDVHLPSFVLHYKNESLPFDQELRTGWVYQSQTWSWMFLEHCVVSYLLHTDRVELRQSCWQPNLDWEDIPENSEFK